MIPTPVWVGGESFVFKDTSHAGKKGVMIVGGWGWVCNYGGMKWDPLPPVDR